MLNKDIKIILSYFQFSSVTQSGPTLYDPMDCSTYGLPITNSWSLLKLMSIELVMPSNHIILCRPLFPLSQSFPASRSFQMSQLSSSGGQSIGVSASTISPCNEHPGSISFRLDWQSKGISSAFSNTTVQKHQLFSAQLSL